MLRPRLQLDAIRSDTDSACRWRGSDSGAGTLWTKTTLRQAPTRAARVSSPTDAADGSVWTGADSWLEESCRAELAAAERLLPRVALPQGAAAASEPQLVEPSPRGPPAPVTWGHRSELKPAKLGMRAALPGKRVSARCSCVRWEAQIFSSAKKLGLDLLETSAGISACQSICL